MRRPSAAAILPALIVLVVAACSSGAATAPPSSSPTAAPSPSPSAAPVGPAATPDEAAALVIASDARFKGVEKKNPDVIGACCFYEATATGGGSFAVTIEVGWGDCPSGCINRHRWFYVVNQDGAIALQREEGQPVPPGVGGGGSAGGSLPAGPGIAVQAVAGPTCAVVQAGDPNCDDRPVAGATVLVRDAHGTVVAQMTTDADGRFQVKVPPGAYEVEPQPVEGFMGTAEKIAVTVGAAFEAVTISYDTGVR